MEQTSGRALLPRGYDAYLFDLYGTLIDISTDEQSLPLWRRLALFYRYYGAVWQPAAMRERYAQLVRAEQQRLAAATGEPDPEIDVAAVFAALFAEKGVSPSGELVFRAGQTFRLLSTRHFRLYPGTLPMLRSLRRHGKQVYLLSNAQRVFTACELDALGLTPCFDDIFLSSDWGVKKPSEAFFRLLLDRHGLSPRQCLYSGNEARADVDGAHCAGMHAFYLRSNLSPAGDDGSAAEYCASPFTGWTAWDGPPTPDR